jgi:hypothetical protein
MDVHYSLLLFVWQVEYDIFTAANVQENNSVKFNAIYGEFLLSILSLFSTFFFLKKKKTLFSTLILHC